MNPRKFNDLPFGLVLEICGYLDLRSLVALADVSPKKNLLPMTKLDIDRNILENTLKYIQVVLATISVCSRLDASPSSPTLVDIFTVGTKHCYTKSSIPGIQSLSRLSHSAFTY